mmetsp:Transcript_90324/g.235352  ORF Transcript_90324/g.235352 Transcript_90324/m.235352 type:complete len:269 (+) Transcript_90324:92-898(+)
MAKTSSKARFKTSTTVPRSYDSSRPKMPCKTCNRRHGFSNFKANSCKCRKKSTRSRQWWSTFRVLRKRVRLEMIRSETKVPSSVADGIRWQRLFFSSIRDCRRKDIFLEQHSHSSRSTQALPTFCLERPFANDSKARQAPTATFTPWDRALDNSARSVMLGSAIVTKRESLLPLLLSMPPPQVPSGMHVEFASKTTGATTRTTAVAASALSASTAKSSASSAKAAHSVRPRLRRFSSWASLCGDAKSDFAVSPRAQSTTSFTDSSVMP